ncbi:MAG: hypothetical protein ACR2QF_11520 [Geminicoccaceae bacterium]
MRLRSWLAPGFLIIVGCLQMIGDITGSRAIRAIGAATGASPAPKVFTAHRGFETYSSQFFIRWTDRNGDITDFQITPATYQNIRGPYNRRNAYGAVLSYAPVLQSDPATRALHDRAMRYTLCGDSTILEELGIDRASIDGPIEVELKPRQNLPEDHGWQLLYQVTCDGQ